MLHSLFLHIIALSLLLFDFLLILIVIENVLIFSLSHCTGSSQIYLRYRALFAFITVYVVAVHQ